MKKNLANLKPQDIRIASYFINRLQKWAIKLHERVRETFRGEKIIRYQNRKEF